MTVPLPDPKFRSQLSNTTMRLAVRIAMRELFQPQPWLDRMVAKADEPLHRWEDDGGGPR